MEKRKSIFDYVKKKLELKEGDKILGINHEERKYLILIIDPGSIEAKELELRGYYIVKEKSRGSYEFVWFPNYYEAYDKLFERK